MSASNSPPPPPQSPTQRSLDELLRRVTRVRVLDGPFLAGGPSPRVLIETKDLVDLAELHDALSLDEARSTFHCMCTGDQTVELYAGDGAPVVLTLHHGESFRWNAWASDAALAVPERLRRWFSNRGIDVLERDHQDRVRRAARFVTEFEAWMSAAPAPLQPFRAELGGDDWDVAHFRRALDAAFRAPALAVRALLRWYGSAHGPWSGHSSYESLPGRLLATYGSAVVLDVVSDPTLESSELEGAARYLATARNLCSRSAARKLERGIAGLPGDAWERLLRHCNASGDATKVAWVTRKRRRRLTSGTRGTEAAAPKRTDSGKEGFPLWPILLLVALPLPAHLLWPGVFLLRHLANLAVLLVGAFLITVMSENIQGNTRYSLPGPGILAVVAIGVASFTIFGWTATAVVLGGCAAVSVAIALLSRSRV